MSRLFPAVLLLVLLLLAPHRAAGAEGGAMEPGGAEVRSATTFGVLQGSSMLGFDHERLLGDRIGMQLGAGVFGFDAGVTYHYRPGVRSRHFYLGFWNLGLPGTRNSLEILAATHVWRSQAPFTAQLGIGARLRTGVNLRDDFVDTPVMLVYSMGLCRTMDRASAASRVE